MISERGSAHREPRGQEWAYTKSAERGHVLLYSVRVFLRPYSAIPREAFFFGSHPSSHSANTDLNQPAGANRFARHAVPERAENARRAVPCGWPPFLVLHHHHHLLFIHHDRSCFHSVLYLDTNQTNDPLPLNQPKFSPSDGRPHRPPCSRAQRPTVPYAAKPVFQTASPTYLPT